MNTSHTSSETEACTIDRWMNFVIGDRPAGYTSLDFWEWYASYSVDASIRGGIAEFVVMKALQLDQMRSHWGGVDLLYNGYGIEVKSASRITNKHFSESDPRLNKNKRIYFDIGMRHHHVSGGNWTDRERASDIYVFCLLDRLPVMNLNNWTFFIMTSSEINRVFGNSKTVSLCKLSSIVKPTPYSGIKSRVQEMTNGGNVMSIEESKEERERQELLDELQRLLACYQLASRDDRNVVWAALNKYAPLIK